MLTLINVKIHDDVELKTSLLPVRTIRDFVRQGFLRFCEASFVLTTNQSLDKC